MYTLSQTSLDKLKGVHPNLVNFMKELIKISPWNFKITAGVRTAEEQNKLYQQGRTVKGIKVTKVDGYKLKSNHQVKYDGLGYAVDIGVLVTEKIIEKVKENGKEVEKEIEKIVYKGSWKDFHYYQDIYNTAKNAGLLEKYGIEWGGNCWKSLLENFVNGEKFKELKGLEQVYLKEQLKFMRGYLSVLRQRINFYNK